MLDTHGRKYFNPIIDWAAEVFLKIGFKANTITTLALILGVVTLPLILVGEYISAVIILWISGFLDAVDGSMARKTKTSSSIGTLMDITFDRIVELIIIVALAIKFEESRMIMLILISCILISMTIFLTVGALVENKGIKSFHYQAGIAERTEGFIMFSLMIILNSHLILITGIFIIIILITIIQRIIEAKDILR
ncbi:MAG: CDP-alcohol phosphatidyltransferase family protein [Clostridium sp.]